MWILDTVAEIGKLSPIQVAMLFFYANPENDKKKVTELIEALQKKFEGFWTPKKGTIYPAIHNLDIRGYLKRHPIKPFGFSITEKGKEAIKQMMNHMESQLAAHIKYYDFVINGMLIIDEKKTKEVLDSQVVMLNAFLNEIKNK